MVKIYLICLLSLGIAVQPAFRAPLSEAPEPIGVFNPLNFTEGLITGLQDPNKPAPSQCLQKFQTIGNNVNAFLKQTFDCFTLHFSSCIGIGNVGRDVVSFIESIETDCQLATAWDKLKSDFSYSGLYNITYRYYWNEKEINGVFDDVGKEYNQSNWFGVGEDVGTLMRDLLDFHVD